MSAKPELNAPFDNSLSAARPSQEQLLSRFREVRNLSSLLATELSAEDACVQSMPDCSPAKWHLAHTSWFFETFLLETNDNAYVPFHPAFKFLFNSYYNTVGEQYARPARGLLTRPTLEDVQAYREHVDQGMFKLLATPQSENLLKILEVGLHHEQQHQELLLMDIKHLFSVNPLGPSYRELSRSQNEQLRVAENNAVHELKWLAVSGGICDIGAADEQFCFDNEMPQHKVYLDDYQIADRLVTNADYLAFINDGGYETPSLWLADGWSTVGEQNWQAPLYWRANNAAWMEFTLHGESALNPAAPVTHVSFYEADAFARWSEARLPTESEWEHAARTALTNSQEVSANSTEHSDLGTRVLQPRSLESTTPDQLRQLFDSVWQWTASAYLPYPGYVTPAGAIGEYNGKFMSNQMVLKGGSCVTPANHSRISYRNFFYPQCRWQFAGIRLAK